MRTLIRLFSSLLGYNVYFVKRKQIDAKLLSSKEYEDKEWAQNKIAKRFESKNNMIFYNLVLSKVNSEIMDIKQRNICDMGCGNGVLINLIYNRFNPISITGFDFSKEAIKIANQRGLKNVICRIHDIYSKCEDKYDLIFCTEVLEHLEYPDIALKNIYESLSSSGIAFITVPNGRLDFFEGHINFWSFTSWNIFLNKSLSISSENIFSGILDKNNMHLYAIIKKNAF